MVRNKMIVKKKTKKKLDPETAEQLRVIENDVKKAAKLSRIYFSKKTQEAIVAYQKTDDKKIRDKIYITDIRPAFEKLAENLINIHKFTSLHDSYEDLRSDCVNFLFEIIHKFDGERGTNAFSYFNVVAKNWLIIKTKQKTQKIKKLVSLDDKDSFSASELKIIDDYQTIDSFEVDFEKPNQKDDIVKSLVEIRNKSKTENELSCINSIITIFENIDNIDLLNKSAILLYMREISGLTPKQLTTTMQTIKKHYKKIRFDFQNDESEE
jgi:hypothetical protein